MKKIITLGGGTGHFTSLNGIKKIKDVSIVAIPSVVDSGGSSGRLRTEWGVLPPSDLFRCILALSPYSEDLGTRELLLHRIQGDNKLNGHVIGNFVLSGFDKFCGDFIEAVKAVSDWLKIKGKVFPATLDKSNLVAVTENEKIYSSEDSLGEREESSKIKNIFLSPPAKAYQPALKEIISADLIIFTPGDFYTSLIPNLLVQGVPEAINKSKARKIFFVNIMTRHSETNNFTAKMHVLEFEKYLKGKVDAVVCNNRKINTEVLKKYNEERAFPVEVDIDDKNWEGRQVIKENLIFEGNLLRHDSDKMTQIIKDLL